MAGSGSAHARVLAATLRQPDQRSCGAAAMVVSRMWHDPGFADRVLDAGRFPDEVRAMHRRLTGPVDVRGRMQPPWPRALGTPPWAVANQLAGPHGSGLAGWTYRTHEVRRGDRAAAWSAMTGVVARGHTVPLYVGSRLLPRHVLLGLSVSDDTLAAYDPARGRARPVRRVEFVSGRLPGWPVPWFVVLPGAGLTR